jgi:hypothetical protein
MRLTASLKASWRKVMTFRTVSSATALIFLTLSVILVAAPQIVYWLFSLQGNDLGGFLAKRAGALFLGLSILCFLACNTSSPDIKRLVSVSVGSAMAAMALLGLYELAHGFAGPGILAAVLTETVIAASFLRIWAQTKAV